MLTWFPRTKLNPPRTGDVVVREPLLADLAKAVGSSKLTLISAPAGSGKTTIISNLVERELTMPVIWLSLDESDNDAILFMSALTAAFQALGLANITQIEAGFEGGSAPDLKQQMAVLINDTLDAPAFLLVLDDLHVIHEAAILQAIDFFIEHLSPYSHVLISTRHDPPLSLARLRSRGQLYECRLDALRFGVDETRVLMNEHLELGLADADLARLVQRTDGWVAGLRLIGLSLMKVSNSLRSQRITGIIGDNRYIFELLADEILKQQDADTQKFLLLTSILDELSPKLCNAVTQRADSHRILDMIYRHNLFLRLVDTNTHTYRYHDLFADFLRHQLRVEYADLIPELHLRAAAVDPIPLRKIEHYLAASAWEEAARLIVEVGVKMAESGNRLTVKRWFETLPESVRDHHGWIVYLQGMLAYENGALVEARRYFKLAETRFREVDDREGIPKALVMHYAASPESEHITGFEALVRSLEPFNLSTSHRLYIQLAPAWVHLYNGNRAQAAAYFLASMNLVEKSPELAGMLGFHLIAPILLVFNEVEPLQAAIWRLMSTLENKIHLLKPALLNILAQIALWQGDLPATQKWMAEAQQQWAYLGGVPNLQQSVVVWQEAVMAMLLHDEATLNRMTQAGREKMSETHLAMLRARLDWLKGDIGEARTITREMPDFYDSETNIVAPMYHAGLQALVEMHDGSIEGVEKILLPAIEAQRSRNYYSLFVTDLRVMLAYLYLQKGMEDDALETITPLIDECERANIPGRIAQEGAFALPVMELALQRNLRKAFVSRVLALLRTETASLKIEETGETLTPREVEVLKMIVTGASNQAIAETFTIGVSTVKTHVSNILFKLNVATRNQAAAKARKLPLF
ncbi:MAG: LuxR C-terminal-related transcriptional regulator [Chloroflexi bacterium]|nr:LuxR C-terminal-related transcriptional regulator [Chloroflexota bacterium]